jgi:hypothetical protein
MPVGDLAERPVDTPAERRGAPLSRLSDAFVERRRFDPQRAQVDAALAAMMDLVVDLTSTPASPGP